MHLRDILVSDKSNEYMKDKESQANEEASECKINSSHLELINWKKRKCKLKTALELWEKKGTEGSVIKYKPFLLPNQKQSCKFHGKYLEKGF